jgi:P-type Cu+ transporter
VSVADVLILVAGLVWTGLLAWYFFGPRRSRHAELDDGVQVIKVTVKGGYSPEVVRVVPGVPVRLRFGRRESSDCSSRVIIPAFGVDQHLPASATTSVDLNPRERRVSTSSRAAWAQDSYL